MSASKRYLRPAVGFGDRHEIEGTIRGTLSDIERYTQNLYESGVNGNVRRRIDTPKGEKHYKHTTSDTMSIETPNK